MFISKKEKIQKKFLKKKPYLGSLPLTTSSLSASPTRRKDHLPFFFCLGKVSIPRHSGGRLVHALQVLALDQGLDLLLDHVDVGLELRAELGDGLGEEVRVGEFFALSENNS